MVLLCFRFHSWFYVRKRFLLLLFLVWHLDFAFWQTITNVVHNQGVGLVMWSNCRIVNVALDLTGQIAPGLAWHFLSTGAKWVICSVVFTIMPPGLWLVLMEYIQCDCFPDGVHSVVFRIMSPGLWLLQMEYWFLFPWWCPRCGV